MKPVAPPKKKAIVKPAAPESMTESTWVEAMFEALEHARVVSERPPADALDEVGARFGLDEHEHLVLRLLGAVERSFPLQRKLGTVTVGLVRALLATMGAHEIALALAPDRALRRHALVHVEGASRRLVAASDVVRLEVGLVPRLVAGEPGLLRCEPSEQPHANELAQRLTSASAQVVLQPSCTREVAQGLADGLRRPVVFGSCKRLDVDRAARVRRDADLDGAVLWLSAVSDELLEALLVVPPAAPLLAPLVILSDLTTAEPVVETPWQLRREKAVETAAPSAPRNDLDYIRALAQRDAERAMGIVRPAAAVPSRQTVPGRIVDASVRVIEEKKPEPAPEVVREAASAIEPEPQPESEPVKKSEPETAPAPEPVPPDGLRLELPADAPFAVRARAATQSPSAQQRIELLESLAGIKHPAAIAALRHNVKNEHPQLRAVAERLMGQLFGAAWNKTRAIEKPVQPPTTEE